MARREHRKVLGQTIRPHREGAGLTQERLAEKSHLTSKYLGEVERGVANISVDTLLRIAKALGLRLNDLTREL